MFENESNISIITAAYLNLRVLTYIHFIFIHTDYEFLSDGSSSHTISSVTDDEVVDVDNASNMDSNYDREPGSSHECISIANSQRKILNGNGYNNVKANEDNLYTGKYIIL